LRKRNASLQRIQQAHHRKRSVVAEPNEIDETTTVTTCEYFAEQITGVVISENYDCFRICGFNFCGHDVRPNGRRRVDGKSGDVRRLVAYLLPYVAPTFMAQIHIAPRNRRKTDRMVGNQLHERCVRIDGSLIRISFLASDAGKHCSTA